MSTETPIPAGPMDVEASILPLSEMRPGDAVVVRLAPDVAIDAERLQSFFAWMKETANAIGATMLFVPRGVDMAVLPAASQPKTTVAFEPTRE